MGDSEGVDFRIVEGEDFVFRLLHENVQPDRQIRANHVHQSKTRDDAMAINLHLLQRDVYYILQLFDR